MPLLFMEHSLCQSALDDAVPKRDLIGKIQPMKVLREEYEGGSASFVKQIDFITSKGFVGVRRSRGDGNCFYRCKLSLQPINLILSIFTLNYMARDIHVIHDAR
jgi:hypothetical protein